MVFHKAQGKIQDKLRGCNIFERKETAKDAYKVYLYLLPINGISCGGMNCGQAVERRVEGLAEKEGSELVK
jgi:hypothetical protein